MGMVAYVPQRTTVADTVRSDVSDVSDMIQESDSESPDVSDMTCLRAPATTGSSPTGTGGSAPVAAVCPTEKAKGVLASLMEEITAGQGYILQVHRLDFTERTIDPMRAHVAALSRAYQKIQLLVVMSVDNASEYQKEYKILPEWYENSKHKWYMMNQITMAWMTTDLDRVAPQAAAAVTAQRWDMCRGGCGGPPG